MAKTTTTAASAVLTSDTALVVASATGFAAGNKVLVDQEWMQVLNSYVSGTTIPVLRGLDGTSVQAHASGANVTTGLGSDFASPSLQTSVTNPIAGRARTMTSYSASGAIALPQPGADAIAILNGTSVLVMTIAAPTKDMDGSILYVVGNGAAAHTVQFVGGLSGAGSSYDIITTNAGAPIGLWAMAVNGLWVTFVAPAMTGTVTNITGGIA